MSGIYEKNNGSPSDNSILLYNIDGVIVLSSAEEIFYGGDLKANQEKFNDITEYSMTFYIMSSNKKESLISNSVVDMTGGTIHISGDIGKRSGAGTMIKELTDELKNNLYFELETTDLDGERSNFQLQLSVVEIIEKTDN